MARFKEEKALHADPEHVRELVQNAIADLDLIIERDSRGNIILKEKYRFDHFNQVELEVELQDAEGDCLISIEGQNQGASGIQLRHVRAKVLELLSRIQIDLEYMEGGEPDLTDPEVIRELGLISDLRSNGALTDHEFEIAKKKILHR